MGSLGSCNALFESGGGSFAGKGKWRGEEGGGGRGREMKKG